MAEGSEDGSPLEFSDVGEDEEQTSSVVTVTEGSWRCPNCSKVLKTRGGFQKHCLLHRLKNAHNSLYEKLQIHLHPIIHEVLIQVKKEPSPDDEFRSICDIVLECFDSVNFSNFLLNISTSVIDILLERKNILLTQFVEESQIQFFSYLADDVNFEDVRSLFCIVLDGNKFSTESVNLFLFRVLSLFFEKCLAVMLSFLRECPESPPRQVELDLKEMEGLLKKSREILQSILTGSILSSFSCKSRIDILCKRFVERPVSSEDFRNSALWEIEDEDKRICFSDYATNFFCYLEVIVKKMIDDGQPVLTDNVFEQASMPGYCSILDSMSALTQGLLSEDDTLEFFSDIIKCFIFMSCHLEAKSIRAEYDKLGNLSVVALRTNLKRNPTKSKV